MSRRLRVRYIDGCGIGPRLLRDVCAVLNAMRDPYLIGLGITLGWLAAEAIT